MPLTVVTCYNGPIAANLPVKFNGYGRNYKEDYKVQAHKELN